MPADEAARIYRETEGNPLFVVEMVRAGERKNDRAVAAARSDARFLPPKVQATIQYRLSQLSANAQALIQIAAVIGREFTFEVLARASDQSEDALVQGLDELWRKQHRARTGRERVRLQPRQGNSHQNRPAQASLYKRMVLSSDAFVLASAASNYVSAAVHVRL